MAVVKLTTAEFENVAAKSAKPVLIDFWASWCGPCRMLSPVIDEVSEERNDVLFCKVNVDEAPELASEFEVMNIPTFMVFKDGECVGREVGFRGKNSLIALLGL